MFFFNLKKKKEFAFGHRESDGQTGYENQIFCALERWSGSHIFELFTAFLVLPPHVDQYRMLGSLPYFVMNGITICLCHGCLWNHKNLVSFPLYLWGFFTLE